MVLYPGRPGRTREVFQAPELTRNSPPTTIRAFLESGGRNDCEAVVRGALSGGGGGARLAGAIRARARLTGTGSCVFAAFARAADAERVAARVPG